MAQLLEGEVIFANKAPHLPKRLRLASARDIRRELARLYGQLLSGDIDNETARSAGFLLRTLLESVRVDEIERRLILLEQSTIQEDDDE